MNADERGWTQMHGCTDAELRSLVKALCELEDGLSVWEMNFVDDMSRKPSSCRFTEKQAAMIVRLYDQLC